MRIIITAGGTGGHIMPAIAIADAIRDRMPDASLLFIGTERGLEEAIALRYGLDFVALDATGIKGKPKKDLLKTIYLNLIAFFKALKLVKKFNPDWVIGTGGYITGIVVLAGFILGSKCAIQEQNSVPGLANRILGRFVRKIFLGMTDEIGSFAKQKIIITGNPVTKDISYLHENGKSGDALLIMGGSLGASTINRVAIKALKICKDHGLALRVIHQTGSRDCSWVKNAYKDMDIDAKVYDLIDDMASVYKRSRLAICRAGAITLTELRAASLPAIIIPYPYAADNHQMKNALHIVSRGGGWVIEENELSPEGLALEIETRLKDKDGLEKASLAMGMLFTPNAAERIAEEIIRV